ncbi:MAG: hypothetical protein IKL62_03010 [Clostridia bacterium]|nr:hypothetical protein [Clostridia bacterium]
MKMFKKAIAVSLAAFFCFSFAACGGGSDASNLVPGGVQLGMTESQLEVARASGEFELSVISEKLYGVAYGENSTGEIANEFFGLTLDEFDAETQYHFDHNGALVAVNISIAQVSIDDAKVNYDKVVAKYNELVGSGAKELVANEKTTSVWYSGSTQVYVELVKNNVAPSIEIWINNTDILNVNIDVLD